MRLFLDQMHYAHVSIEMIACSILLKEYLYLVKEGSIQLMKQGESDSPFG